MDNESHTEQKITVYKKINNSYNNDVSLNNGIYKIVCKYFIGLPDLQKQFKKILF